MSYMQQARALCQVPLIASGGAGAMEHFAEAFDQADVDGALAASVFHSGAIAIPELALPARTADRGAGCLLKSGRRRTIAGAGLSKGDGLLPAVFRMPTPAGADAGLWSAESLEYHAGHRHMTFFSRKQRL